MILLALLLLVMTPLAMSGEVDAASRPAEAAADDVPSKGTLRIVLHALLKAVDELPEDARSPRAAVPAAVAASPPAPPSSPAVESVPVPPPAQSRPAARPDWPAWVSRPPHKGETGYEMAIATEFYATQRECESHLPEEVQKAVDQYAGEVLAHRVQAEVHLPADCLGQDPVREKWVEVKQFSVGPMVRLHARLEFDHNAKQRVETCWDEAFVQKRVRSLAGLGLVVLVLLAEFWAYLQADLATAGRYRLWLRLATLVAVLAVLAAVMA